MPEYELKISGQDYREFDLTHLARTLGKLCGICTIKSSRVLKKIITEREIPKKYLLNFNRTMDASIRELN